MASTTQRPPRNLSASRLEEVSTRSDLPQLKELAVEGLFGTFNHRVDFPEPDKVNPRPSLRIIHGHNGVGKTRLLLMLDGFLRLDFDAFRKVPFGTGRLVFSNGDAIQVSHDTSPDGSPALLVEFQERKVRLNPESTGGAAGESEKKIEAFRKEFFTFTQHLTFEFIDAERLIKRYLRPPDEMEFLVEYENPHLLRRTRRKGTKKDSVEKLAEKVRSFISEAQLNYRAFFSSREPDLFPRILQHLTASKPEVSSPSDILQRLKMIKQQDLEISRFGLEADRWDFEQLTSFVESSGETPEHKSALVALSAYLEVLESRAAERMLVAKRLLTFEQLMNEFFEAKRVVVDARSGLNIITVTEMALSEDQLSSGEFHLLYLMVSALTTKRRGTIVAIDEPEMSMHISWQRKLVRALLTCASGAEPQFIFATHSPDVAAEFEEQMVKLPN